MVTDHTAEPIRRINPPDLGSPPGYSQIVEVQGGHLYFIAGQTALDNAGALVGKNDFAAQAEQVFQNLGRALQAVGCTPSNLVKLTVFLRDMGHLAAYRGARNRFSLEKILHYGTTGAENFNDRPIGDAVGREAAG